VSLLLPLRGATPRAGEAGAAVFFEGAVLCGKLVDR